MSCCRKTIKDEIDEFLTHSISLPIDSMQSADEFLYSGSHKQIPKRNYIYVHYIDTMQCTGCEIKHLKDWVRLENRTEEKGFNVFYAFVLAPSSYLLGDVRKALSRDTLLNSQIFIDTCNAFLRANPHIPSNPLLHSFLLDENDSVILVGNPVRNKKIEELFFKILEEKKEEHNAQKTTNNSISK